MQTQDVREAAQSAVDQSKSFLSKQVDERSTQLGQQIETVAQDLRRVGDHLRETEVGGGAARYVDQGVELIERLARYLEDSDGERLIGDAENYVRRQPWALAGVGLVLGFAASRFLKASSARRYRETYGGTQSYGTQSDGTPSSGTPSYGTPSYGTRSDGTESYATQSYRGTATSYRETESDGGPYAT
ncbi:MAG: hypothetical protein JO083_09185 [Candidatus Eremiobacteraeota bacterium]|nr:hypothetical protein [Candidatus Eremiobacteraeota bacterium]